MALPTNTATVLKASFPAADPADNYTVAARDGVVSIARWDAIAIGAAEPTEQQITDWSTDAAALPVTAGDYSGELFSLWQTEHGGDELATVKRQTREALANNRDLTRAAFQALIILLVDNLAATAWKTGTSPTAQQGWSALKTKIDEITQEP